MGCIGFAGSQTLSGSGTVVFGEFGNAYNAVCLINGGHDADHWERDHGAWAERDDWLRRAIVGGPANVMVPTRGRSPRTVAGTITVNAQPLVTTGQCAMSNGGSLNINYLANVVGLSASGSGTLTLNGNWQTQGCSVRHPSLNEAGPTREQSM